MINSGSSSIRFRIVDSALNSTRIGQESLQPVIHGILEGIGSVTSLTISEQDHIVLQSTSNIENHEQAFAWLFEGLSSLQQSGTISFHIDSLEAVGHRVVHGGDRFTKSTVIDDQVIEEIEQLNELAPLHNPACLTGIYSSQYFLNPSIPMIAVFDTTFHHTLPAHAATYAIPFELAERHHIKKYGFHGIAHASLAMNYAQHSGTTLKDQRLITLQLGNGCSMTAIASGRSVDTSMGFTPCEGLMMGTRSGDIDPSIVSYLTKKEQISAIGVQTWLNEHSGLLGVSGTTNNMRLLLDAATRKKDKRATLAIDMFCYQVQKYLGAYAAVLEGVDAIVFGGGIGENAPLIRAKVCERMKWCGVHLNKQRNQHAVGVKPGSARIISQDKSTIKVYVIGTDEESWIASETAQSLNTSAYGERVNP